MAKDHNISRLEVETDAQALKIMINRADKYPHHQLSAIICDIVKLLKSNWVVIFLHAKRDVNIVAHKLARFGIDMEVDKVTHTSPPQCIMQHAGTYQPHSIALRVVLILEHFRQANDWFFQYFHISLGYVMEHLCMWLLV